MNACQYLGTLGSVEASASAPGADEVRSDEVEAVMLAARMLVAVSAQSVAEVEDQVTLAQLRVLVMVASGAALNLGTVAKALGVHASNAKRVVDRLVTAGRLNRRMTRLTGATSCWPSPRPGTRWCSACPTIGAQRSQAFSPRCLRAGAKLWSRPCARSPTQAVRRPGKRSGRWGGRQTEPRVRAAKSFRCRGSPHPR